MEEREIKEANKLIAIGAKNVAIVDNEYDGQVLHFELAGKSFSISASCGQSCGFIEVEVNDINQEAK